MSVILIAVATESGVPIFSRKRGNNESVSYLINYFMLQKFKYFLKCIL